METLTAGRFRAWVGMEAAPVAALSADIQKARAQMTGQQAMRSTTADQAAAARLTAEEVATLSALAPSFRDALPAELRESMETVARREREAEPGEPPARPERKAPFWKFWQR